MLGFGMRLNATAPTIACAGATVSFLLIFAIVEVLIYQFHILPEYGQEGDIRFLNAIDVKLEIALQRASKNKKVILLWEEREEFKDVNRTLDYDCGSCDVSSNLVLVDHPDTAAVVILFKSIIPKLMPLWESSRRSDQLYVWKSKETPVSIKRAHFGESLILADSLQFNVTMTNRRDADIYLPYGSSIQLRKSLKSNLSAILHSKTRLAVTVVSNCNFTPAAVTRFQYYKLIIASGFNLDGFGECFPGALKLPINGTGKLFNLIKQYKFYFAFENSYHCKDYITEKFFRSLKASTVPVVWGATREDYEAVAPPNSFIYVDDFPSMTELLRYLNYLDKNDTAYLEYFRWTSIELDNATDGGQQSGVCQLCRILHGINIDDIYKSKYNASSSSRPLFTPRVTGRTVPSLMKWIMNEHESCFKNLELNENGKIIPINYLEYLTEHFI